MTQTVHSCDDVKMQWRGLYAIADTGLIGSDLMDRVAQAIQGGASVVQYRSKEPDPLCCSEEARALLALCRRHGVPLIINDDVALAEIVGADGVHVGRDDASLAEARTALGPRAFIGVSCYNSLERALEAQAAGADYVAFGRFFASLTKPNAVSADPSLLREVRKKISIPIVAIGGITPENGRALIEAGADMLAVIHGLFGHPDVTHAANRYTKLFQL
ncbi:MAG: thiamine phosphate synthase [Gammaproteobacteria bacterium]|nr:thiamine phosphate synthase [Gammaproteobacteria bacterium]